MATSMARGRTLLILLVLAVIAAMAIGWQLQIGKANRPSEADKTPTADSGRRTFFQGDSVPIDASHSMEERARSLEEAAQKTGLPVLKAPLNLFGGKGQIFFNPVRTTIYYSSETTPTTTDALIGVRRHDPNLATPADFAAQARKDRNPLVSFREHKGHPGFAIEKGINSFRGGKTPPSPAVISWLNGHFEYTVKGPLGMGLDELIPIADSID